MSLVQQSIEVGAPLHTVYEQIATFENYPRFMTGVEEVTPIGTDRTHWVMDVDGHRREFDAQITELALDERVSWATTDGPRLSETITLRPMGETRTQLVAQLDADVAFLLPSDRHGQETLTRQLKNDLNTFKGLVESGVLGAHGGLAGASTKQLTGRSSTVFGSPPTPASVAARIKRRENPHPGAGWGTSASGRAFGPDRGGAEDGMAKMGTNVDITSAPGITNVHDLDDVLAPGRRIGGPHTVRGSAAGTRTGTAEMGGRTQSKDTWGDGMINEEDRGSAHDYGG
ncbi:SRPBCC family protein [Actinoplanes sp. NPDC049265]|uniref:SRPBCC family protein n=1 Tax=Actinoplanes sp. NPDC049265 TaxID=3363902 RepID=UPI0037142187